MIVLITILAVYVAWNLGANDVANSMGTSVGSKAVTLRQALAIAGILEFTGAVFFGERVSTTLIRRIVDPALFVSNPDDFALGMIAALLACGLWLQIATWLRLPVSSSHAIVGGIAGFGWVAQGMQAVNWAAIGLISVLWVLTPIVSGAIAATFYQLIRHWIVDHPNSQQQLYEWIPWLSTTLVSILGAIVWPALIRVLSPEWLPLPQHDLPLLLGGVAIWSLTLISWRFARSLTPSTAIAVPIQEGPSGKVERSLAQFQVLSACFVAFAHGSNDVGNAVAPLAAIAYLQSQGTVPLTEFAIPVWILAVGGAGIVGGLAVWGKRVIQTIGEEITPLQPSSGFCAELATATTTLLASRLGLPVSTSHALVGAVVGVGLVQPRSTFVAIQRHLLQQIAGAWLVSIPIAAGLSAMIFAIVHRGLPMLSSN
jgi:PiT family inorganic phosphate transporter